MSVDSFAIQYSRQSCLTKTIEFGIAVCAGTLLGRKVLKLSWSSALVSAALLSSVVDRLLNQTARGQRTPRGHSQHRTPRRARTLEEELERQATKTHAKHLELFLNTARDFKLGFEEALTQAQQNEDQTLNRELEQHVTAANAVMQRLVGADDKQRRQLFRRGSPLSQALMRLQTAVHKACCESETRKAKREAFSTVQECHQQGQREISRLFDKKGVTDPMRTRLEGVINQVFPAGAYPSASHADRSTVSIEEVTDTEQEDGGLPVVVASTTTLPHVESTRSTSVVTPSVVEEVTALDDLRTQLQTFQESYGKLRRIQDRLTGAARDDSQ